ncbi:MAG: glycosyltransferase family 9 protein [Candidatus Binatia bacterium]
MASPSGYIRGARPIDTWVGLVICALLFGWSRIRSLFDGPRLPPMRATTPPIPGTSAALPRRVLGIKFYGLGNIVMLLPALQALRETFPAAEIDFLTFEENRILLERSGLITRTIGVSMRDSWSLVRSLLGAIRTVLGQRYDVVLDFEQFIKLSAIIAFLTGAPRRVGFNTDGQHRAWLYTTRVVYTDSDHMSRIFMRILRAVGVIASPRPTRIITLPAEEEHVETVLREQGIVPGSFPLIAVHVGSGPNFYRLPLKRWPSGNFAHLCDALEQRHGATVVLTGKGPEERALVCETRAQMQRPAVDLCDRLSLPQLVALLRQCHLVVANDTSVMHLAAAVGTPVVAFFGPTAPLHYGPGNRDDLVFYRDLYCSPCLTNYNLKVSRCLNPVCIRSIDVEDVLHAIEARFFGPSASLRARVQGATSARRQQRAAAG